MGGHPPRHPTAQANECAPRRAFELFVNAGYSELELAAITHTLAQANDALVEDRFTWRFVSDVPGLVKGAPG